MRPYLILLGLVVALALALLIQGLTDSVIASGAVMVLLLAMMLGRLFGLPGGGDGDWDLDV